MLSLHWARPGSNKFFLTDNTTAFLYIPPNKSLSMVIISCDLEPIISGTSSAKRHIKVLPGRKQLQKVVQILAAAVMVTQDSGSVPSQHTGKDLDSMLRGSDLVVIELGNCHAAAGLGQLLQYNGAHPPHAVVGKNLAS